MAHESPTDAEIEGWLKTLGVESLCQCDVLAFLYRHQTSLVGAEYIARLLGYPDEPVVAALDVLESLGFVKRSRVSQNVRLYQFTMPSEPPHRDAFERILALAGHRAGRLLLSQQLRRGERPPSEGLEAARRFPAEAQHALRMVRELPQSEKRRVSWLKAI